MHTFDPATLKKLSLAQPDSHKGQNGKLLLIGGSRLFHAASLWPLTVASRIVDMVFYASVPENNELVQKAKEEFRDGIVIPRNEIEHYITEADCVLIGPGMVRSERNMNSDEKKISIQEINELDDEGEQTYQLTKYLLQKYPEKKWVIDGGALQMMEKEWLQNMKQVILTPHLKEFERLFGLPPAEEHVQKMAKAYSVIILRKGEEDITCSPTTCVRIAGGSAGMTKGGTGDVLAGLVAALSCNNDLFLSAQAGSYINKKAGASLSSRVGAYFNASDLVNEIPSVLARETGQVS